MNDDFCVYLIGPMDAGKTTFVRSICQADVRSPEYQGDECHDTAFNEGKLYLGLDIIRFWAMLNNRRFDYLWLLRENNRCLGMILVIDSSDFQRLREVRSHITTMRAYCPLPCIIAANKQDKHDAVSASDLKYILRIPDEIPIVPCVATNYTSVKQVLLDLLQETLKWAE